MGTWHVCGLGLNPGAVTVPLTYVYLFLKLAARNEERAKSFFQFSGEKGQETKGAPESIIIFSSKEVITGKSDGKPWSSWQGRNITDKWFQTKKQKTPPLTICKYLSKLLEKLRDNEFSEFYENKWLKKIYFLEVKHDDFDDCFYKIGVTLNALKRKEVWTNMIGGTNQINLALLTAGSFSATLARYYYVFQSNILLLHPETEKPNMKNPRGFIKNMDRWRDLPIFHLDLSPLIHDLNELFQGREKVNVREIENVLEQHEHTKQYLAKLRGRMIILEGDVARQTNLLMLLNAMRMKIQEKNVQDVSKWKKWASDKGILHEFDLDD
ncbi:MAG: hypothetical protein JRJ62_11115 [Deltaproteobacteria bacterium]|nr:hypothetical protein [Deltaproteobacteria bacterium]